MKQDRVTLTPDEVDALMPPGDDVHTLIQAGSALIGADWSRSQILAAAASGGAELAGESATAMNHGIVIWQGDGDDMTPVFVATIHQP